MDFFKPGVHQQRPVRLIAFVREVGMVCVCVRACVCVCVCVHVHVRVRACVSIPEATNNIHMIFNLYNQLNKFIT